MNQLMKKAGVLLGIFIAAVAIYFIWSQNTAPKSSTVYTSMEEPELPVVYTEMFGRDMNCLRGYRQDMKQTVSRDSLTILPEDLQLRVKIDKYSGGISKINYEIRSLDLERLVEKTTIENWDAAEGMVTVVLPIQNLLNKETEYMLCLVLETEQFGEVRYYTRILWTDNQNAGQMVDLAVEFSTKTYDYNQARDLVTYLETNQTEDNSSLGHVTIRSSFSQLTWGGLKMKQEGPVTVTMKELDGIMGQVRLNYLATRETEKGGAELYEVEENFIMKWSPQRIYLMNYDRTADQVFSGERALYSGKRIMLGITNDKQVRAAKSANQKYITYVTNRDLWFYNQDDEEAVRIFSFRSGKDDGLRSNYNQHNIKTISVEDSGNVDFLVYGYMNRGKHEGNMGVSLYRYDAAADTIGEKFFIPVTSSFEELEQDLNKLSYIGNNGMLFMMINHAVYGVDLNSNEYLVVADALTEGSYAISKDGSRFACQEGNNRYESKTIHIMNLETGRKDDITAPVGSLVRALGFVGSDFVYGMANPGDEYIINGRIEDMPMYALEIVDGNMQTESRYEKAGSYISSVKIEDSRIRLDRMVKSSPGSYVKAEEDIIVCNADVGPDDLKGIGWYASSDRRKLYFVQVDTEIKSNRNIKISAPKKLTYDTSETIELKANTWDQGMNFYAYGNGHLLGTTQNFAQAIALAYEDMGIVTDGSQNIVWNRVNKENAKTIRDPEMTARKLTKKMEDFTQNKVFNDGILILDARGCTLNQILYFIGQGCPVAAYTESGNYVMIYGYDQYNISIYNPISSESYKMGLNDATEYFLSQQNDFICGVFLE